MNTISNGELSDPLCDSVNRGLALVRLTIKYDVKLKDNHKICTQVAVAHLKGMYELHVAVNDRYEFLK